MLVPALAGPGLAMACRRPLGECRISTATVTVLLLDTVAGSAAAHHFDDLPLPALRHRLDVKVLRRPRLQAARAPASA